MKQNTEIKDVGYRNLLPYVKNTYPKWRIFLIVLNIIFILLIWFQDSLGFILLVLAIDFVASLVFLTQMKKDFMKQYAKLNGYEYSEYGNINNVKSLYLNMGHSRKMLHVISGIYQDCPLTLFEFACIIGYGKNKKYIQFTTFEIEYKSKLQSIFLRSKKDKWAITNFFQSIGDDMAFGKVLKLEGDFNKYFTLYVPNEDYEIEALQIFTPEIMAKLIDTGNGFSFEFLDNKLFIYSHKIIYKKADLENIYQFAKTLITDLAPRLERI